MIGMAYTVDAAFLDAEDRLLEVRRVAPWRFARVAGARSVIEASPGTFTGLERGAHLRRV